MGKKDSINEVMDKWLLNCNVRGLSDATMANYSSTCKMFIEVIGNKSIDDFSSSDIDQFTLYLRKHGNNTICL